MSRLKISRRRFTNFVSFARVGFSGSGVSLMASSNHKFPGISVGLLDAKKSKLEIEPIDGPTIANTIANLYELDSATIAKLKEVLVAKK